MHVWGKWNAKSGMLGLFPWMFKHSPLPDAHLKYYHTWKRCTSGLSFFKQMNEDQHCHQDPRWLCWLWLCSGLLVHENEQPIVFPLLCCPGAFIWIRLRRTFQTALDGPTEISGWPGAVAESRMWWGVQAARPPPPAWETSALAPSPSNTPNNGSTTCSPTWAPGCLCPGLHASGVARGFWAAQGWAEHTSSAVPSPRAGSRRWNATGSLSRPTRDRIATFINASTKKTQLGIKH